MTDEIYESQLRSDGKLGAFFEDDGDTGHFYLWHECADEGENILSAMRIYTGRPAGLSPSDVKVLWDRSETRVALAIQGRIVAAYDVEEMMGYGGEVHGDKCRQSGERTIPAKVLATFDLA